MRAVLELVGKLFFEERDGWEVVFCHVHLFHYLFLLLFYTINMGLLSIIETHKDDLKFLSEQPDQISGDFCKLAWSFLCKGSNLKMYQTASQKLQADVKQIQSAVEALANLFIEVGKNELTEEEFKETMMDLGFSEDACGIIYSEYLTQKEVLGSSLPLAGMQQPQFKNLEWRFETEVSSRSIKSKNQPRVIIKLDLEKGSKRESFSLRSDIPNVIHLSQVVNQALQESKTQHCKRIQRAVT